MDLSWCFRLHIRFDFLYPTNSTVKWCWGKNQWKYLQNLLFAFSQLFLLSQFVNGKCDVRDTFLKAKVSFLLEFRGGFFNLIDNTLCLANYSIRELLLVARNAWFQLIVVTPIFMRVLWILSNCVMIKSTFKWHSFNFQILIRLQELFVARNFQVWSMWKNIC